MKKIFFLLLMVVFTCSIYADGTATISAVVDGYKGRVVDFEFIDNPDNNMSYSYTDGKRMEFDVELNEPSLLKINAWIWVLVSPGDDINVNIHYEGTTYKTAESTGTPKAGLLNETIRDMRNSRMAVRSKLNSLAALATLVAPEIYYQTSLDQWAKEKGMLEAIKSKVDSFAYNYIYSEHEGTFMSNWVNYPYLSAGYSKKPLEECIPAGYWDVLNDYQLRSDTGSLKSFTYLSWILDYQKYVEAREAHRQNKPYMYYDMDLQRGFDSLLSFYKGDLLDGALYIYLYNAITRQQNFELVESLTKQYVEKYNKNELYKETLLEMLQ